MKCPLFCYFYCFFDVRFCSCWKLFCVWPAFQIIQVLVELAELQDKEVGDGTTSVVIVAAELLKVIRGYHSL